MFLIRSVFRTVELSEGYSGYLSTHERYFFGLDTLPLFLGIIVYMYYWPPAILTPETRITREDSTELTYASGIPEFANGDTTQVSSSNVSEWKEASDKN
jgi:hypothetical protein